MKIYLRTSLTDQNVIHKFKDYLEKDNQVEISILEEKNKDEYASDNTGEIIKYDIFLVEASIPSAQLGYEVGFALNKNIPTAILYTEDTGSSAVLPLLTNTPEAKIIIKGYKIGQLEETLRSILDEMAQYTDTRFALNLTPQISEFLNWVTKNKKVTRADYIRSLIESALKKSTDYKSYLKKKD